MAYQNPYVTNRPLPPLVQQPTTQDMLNSYLSRNYPGGILPSQPSPTHPSPTTTPDMTGAAIGAGVAGLGLITDAVAMGNQPLGIETSAPGLERSATGEPVYNLGNFYNAAATAKPQGATTGEVGGGIAKGAAAGAAFGVPGAVIGGLAGGLSNLIGGNRRKRKQAAQKRKATQSAIDAQKQYNVASEAFDESQATQSEYLKRMNNTNRMFNLYRANP